MKKRKVEKLQFETGTQLLVSCENLWQFLDMLIEMKVLVILYEGKIRKIVLEE